MTKPQRSYHAFVRAVKRSEGLTQREAQAAYRALKDRLDRPPRAKDIAEHPRMTRDAVKAARPPAKPKKEPKPKPPAPKKVPAKKVPPAKPKKVPAKKVPPAKPKKVPAKKVPAKKVPAKKVPAKKVPPPRKRPPAPPRKRPPGGGGERVLHAGIRYRKGGKKGDELRIEVAVRLAAGVAIAPDQLNPMLQEYAKSGHLPKGVKVELITWQHGDAAEGSAEGQEAIEFARENMLGRIAGAGEFHDLGGGEGTSGTE